MTWKIEWAESVGGDAPGWLAELLGDDDGVALLHFLAGASLQLGGKGADADATLIELLSAVPRDSAIASGVDRAAANLLTLAERRIADDPTIWTQGLLGVLTVASDVGPWLPRSMEAIRERVNSGAYLSFSAAPGADLQRGYLHAAAVNQVSAELIPLWWRLCDFESTLPEHAEMGLLGLRWSPLGVDDGFERVLGRAFASIADAGDRFVSEELVSESRIRRFFLGLVRTTARTRGDLQWDEVEAACLADTHGERARRWVARAFGIEGTLTPTRKAATYEDPATARMLAGRLRTGEAAALTDASTFLEKQRIQAVKRGDPLPLVQSLCYFANAFQGWDAARSTQWAAEAADWQPLNHYTAVTWAAARGQVEDYPQAAAVLLHRFRQLTDQPIVWLETAKYLESLGETAGAAEALTAHSERFPYVPAGWSALGEFFVRNGHFGSAVTAFARGLREHPTDRYLLPGQVRAQALNGDLVEARGTLKQAEVALGSGNDVVTKRAAELEKNEFTVRPVPPLDIGWRNELSGEGLAALSLLLRRAARRPGAVYAVVAPRGPSIADTLLDRTRGVGVAAELALSGHPEKAGAVPFVVGEIVRVREERASQAGCPFTADRFRALVVDGERGGVSDRRLAPLVELTRLRASSTLVDGSALDEQGGTAVEHLRALIATASPRPPGGDSRPASLFEKRAEWSEMTLRTLDLPSSLNGAGTEGLRKVVDEQHVQLDGLEEDMAISLGV